MDSEEDGSDSSDQFEDFQSKLQQKLDFMLEEQIGQSKRKKPQETHPKVKRSKAKDKTDKIQGDGRNRADSLWQREHVHAPKNSEMNIKKIQDFTTAAKRDMQRSNSAKLARQSQVIQDKIRMSFQTHETGGYDDDESESSAGSDVENENDDFCDFDNASDENSDSEGSVGSDEEFSGEELEDEVSNRKRSSSNNNQIEKFKRALGISDSDIEQAKKQQKMREEASKRTADTQVRTLGLAKSSKKWKAPEVVVFEDPAKRASSKQNSNKKTAKSKDEPAMEEDDGTEFDLRSARFEVRKFGIKGLQGDSKEKGMVDLLVSLGAKPPKKEKVNYKQLQEERKQQKLDEIEKRKMDRQLGFKVIRSKSKHRGREKKDIGSVDGQIGSYRSGVQFVNKKTIEKVNKKQIRRR